MTETAASAEQAVEAILHRLGKRIVLALPLGLGKANHLVNELYRRAEQDRTLQLTIYTALTLEPPLPDNELARRFLQPIAHRFFSHYPRLAYARALREGGLPANIEVREFFLQPGNWLGHPYVQQHYTTVNYTHALDFFERAGINLVLQLFAPDQSGERYSLSCNPDLTPDFLQARREGRMDFLYAGQSHRQLPYMFGQADRPRSEFDLVLDDAELDFPLFQPPHEPVDTTDHAIALHAAKLVRDGGTLQIGIGSIGDAIASALILRHRQPDTFDALCQTLGSGEGEQSPFEQGLYGLSEMLVEGFLALMEAGILKRTVDGYCIHAGFFMGSPSFYRTLAAMDESTRRRIAMTPISYINELYGNEAQKRAERRHARFINCAMMVTLDGAAVSDGLESGQIVSGVGGQYNFVSQSRALGSESRSIITLRATRTRRGKTRSNIRPHYGRTTIPSHLKDIIVTEYGAADLRDKSDAETAAALIEIADSRFQPELIKSAQRAGKLPLDYRLPEHARRNRPERLHHLLTPALDTGLLQRFPLGSDFSDTEQNLAGALAQLSRQVGGISATAGLLWDGLGKSSQAEREALERMGLTRASSPRQWLYRTLLAGALKRTL